MPRKQTRFVERNVNVTKQEKKGQTVKDAWRLKQFTSSVSSDISKSRNTIRKHLDPKCMKFHLHRVISVRLYKKKTRNFRPLWPGGLKMHVWVFSCSVRVWVYFCARVCC